MHNEGDKRQVGHGTKAMLATEHITIILCANATGTCKLVPVVIGSAKTPRCFKYNKSSVPYLNQKNAWNDKNNYNKWWHDAFLNAVRKWTTDPVALLIDGFSGHDSSCSDPLQQLKFPPNVTSIFQPLDQDVIATFKPGYKNKSLETLVSTASNFEALQVIAKQLAAGVAGLKYGSPPNISDATDLVKFAWDSISQATISACWECAQCLPVNDTADAASSGRDYKKQLEDKTIDDICTPLSALTLPKPHVHVASMLKTTGLEELVRALQNVQEAARVMLHKWLNYVSCERWVGCSFHEALGICHTALSRTTPAPGLGRKGS